MQLEEVSGEDRSAKRRIWRIAVACFNFTFPFGFENLPGCQGGAGAIKIYLEVTGGREMKTDLEFRLKYPLECSRSRVNGNTIVSIVSESRNLPVLTLTLGAPNEWKKQ